MLRRLHNACLIRPEDIVPSDVAMEVVGAFNPGAIEADGEAVLLVRVAERPKEARAGMTALPRVVPGRGIVVDWVKNEALRILDPRVVEMKANGAIRLTFVSRLVVVRSRDGRSVDRIGEAGFAPAEPYETYGVEDPRITRIGDTFYFTYVAVSRHGAATALASTRDFQSFTRHGVIFPPENKDVVLFPERIGGRYAAFHRPNPATHFSPPEMWLAYSDDLVDWGGHEPFQSGSGAWETGRIGAGCPPVRTDGGWLAIYHGNERAAEGVGAYCAGAFLLDASNPRQILRRSVEPIMTPETDFERQGFVGDVVFPTATIDRGDTLQVFYGAADANVGVVEWSKAELMAALA